MDARTNDLTLTPTMPAPRWRWLRRLVMLVLPLLILGAGFAGFGWLRATRPAVQTERPAEKARLVTAQQVRPGRVQPSLSLFGQVAIGRSVDLRALVAGTIIEVSPALRDGGLIEQGATVLRIDPFAYEGAVVRAKADLDETRARMAEIEARVASEQAAIQRLAEQVDIATRENARVSQLARTGATTQRALDDSALRLSQSRAALEARQNQLAIFQAQRAQLDASRDRQAFALRQAERNLADTVLTAPFAAIVSNPAADIGKLVGANDRVATLVARDALEVRFSLPASQYARLAADGPLEGRSATMTWETSSPGEGAVRALVVTRVAAQASGGNVDLFARFVEPAPAMLRPGSFVAVTMADRPVDEAVLVPEAALHDGHVLVIRDDRIRRVPVETRAFLDNQVVITGALDADMRIVTSRIIAPLDGQLVRIAPRDSAPDASQEASRETAKRSEATGPASGRP